MTQFDPAPLTLDTALMPEWLSAMLGANWPGAEVRQVDVVEVLATQATKARIALVIDGGMNGAGQSPPTRLCIKGVLTDTGAVHSASIVETLFYREAAAALPVRVPGCIHAALSDDGSRGVIVMHDVIAAGGRFCSALEPLSPDEARDGLAQLVQLHLASQPGSPAFGFGWARSFLDQISKQPIIPEAALQALLDGSRGALLVPAVRNARRLQTALEALAAEVRQGPLCLVHGDAHAGNIYRQADAAQVDQAVHERALAVGKTNISRAVTELVRAGLVRRHYAGWCKDHANRGGGRHAVYTVDLEALSALRRRGRLL